MQAWIERIDGQFRNINIFTAWQGLEAMGYETHFCTPDEAEELPLDANTPLIAGIPPTWRALQKLGLGCYGLASHLYAPMLVERWREIIKSGRSF